MSVSGERSSQSLSDELFRRTRGEASVLEFCASRERVLRFAGATRFERLRIFKPDEDLFHLPALF
jgi:hypothetical protein